MSKDISVKKRNGKFEKFDADKINKVLQWSVDGIDGVSFNDVAMNAHISFFDGMTSIDIHNTLIESAAQLISEENPDYQYVAGRLLNYSLRKSVWGGKNPPKLIDLIKQNIKHDVYDNEVLEHYTESELNKIDDFIDHDRDLSFTYAGIKQLCDKYLVQNRQSKRIYETPQFAYVLIAMILFKDYKNNRLSYVKNAYNCFSKHKISLPTPIMAGVRTKMKSYASCALFSIDDTLASIFANNSAIGMATASRYGIGINPSRIRANNAPVKGGQVLHTGPVPFLKMYESTVKSCHQNGLRGGGGTANFAWFHYDILDILVLKNNAGTDDNRVRKLDYAIGLDKLILERYIKGQDITLFSYHECPELWNNFGLPNFRELYEKAELNPSLKFKKKIPAKEFIDLLVKERFETGRIYILFVDHANEHGSWLEHIEMTNLCCEILHPVVPIQSLEDANGEIGVCILAALNPLAIKDDKDLENSCDISVRMLDSLISYQDYFLPAAQNFATKRRSLGIGITNLAALLAKNKTKFTDENAPNFVASFIEKMSYFLIKSSVELAKEFGPCEKFNLTKYHSGVLPIDTYKKDIDVFVTAPLLMNWEGLRKEILQHGMRNSTLMAFMPVESSSLITNSTNGCEPPRSLISNKVSKSSSIPFVVPNIKTHAEYYTLAYDPDNNDGYLKVAAAIQKFTDMAMSVNTYYSPSKYADKKVPASAVILDILNAYKFGLKTLYYANTDDGDKQSAKNTPVVASANEEPVVEFEDCPGGACRL